MGDSRSAAFNVRHFISQNRIFVLFVAVFLSMASVAPHFVSAGNVASILRGVSINALLATGLAIVLIVRQLDLSFAAVLSFGAALAVSVQPRWGWAGAFAVTIGLGLVVGLVNGWLVAKIKVDSFIATLGTMMILGGVSLKFCNGNTLNLDDFATSQWLETASVGQGTWLGVATSPLVLIAVGVVLVFELFLKRTTTGRALFLVGGNPKTAWYSGLSIDRLTIGAFVISGVLAGVAGALTAMRFSAAQPGVGTPSLMVVIAAVIVGGTSMDGGRGSVFKSLIALVTLEMITNGFNLRGAGAEIIAIASGITLGAVIVYDAVILVRKNKVKGQRHELLEELAQFEDSDSGSGPPASDSFPLSPEDDPMQRKQQVPMSFCLGALVAVSAVAIAGMYFIYQLAERHPPAVTTAATNTPAAGASGVGVKDIYALKSTDGQPLLAPPDPDFKLPPRPENPDALPETDPGHWYDQEYAGWGIQRINPVPSPGTGPKGKKILHLQMTDHVYFDAVDRGMQEIADHYGMELKRVSAGGNASLQAKQVDQAINEKPDMVIINPVDAKGSVNLLRKLNEARIPVIVSNSMCSNEALAYALAWCGPDDWGNNRNLAKVFAEKMNYEGGYCIVRHLPGHACYNSRTWSIVTELKKIAPKMELLATQTANLDKNEAEKITAGWITRFGSKLKGITSADDSGTQLGVNKACKDANRTDIVRVAAGNSKVGMDAVKDGEVAAITVQSAEGDGALAVEMAAEWFSGKKLPEVRYLPRGIITPDTVKQFLPPQW